jgi:hypothetical protein
LHIDELLFPIIQLERYLFSAYIMLTLLSSHIYEKNAFNLSTFSSVRYFKLPQNRLTAYLSIL